MSASDYTAMQKLRNLYTVNYNTIPGCAGGCHDPASQISYYGVPGQISHTHPNYPMVPTNHHQQFPIQGTHQHQAVHTHNPYGTHGHVVEHSHQPSTDASCNLYYTTTARKYYVNPVEGGGTTVNVCSGLLFVKGNPVYVSNYDLSGNYFKAVISEYNKDTGEITLKNITNIRGQFNGEYTYTISIIFENPELFELQEQMAYLYKYVFNINLVTDTSYVTPPLELVDIEKGAVNLYLYFFGINVRNDDSNYAQTSEYLTTLIDNLYLYFFEVDLTKTTTFTLVEGKTNTSTLLNKVYGLYEYFFEINLATTPSFNPNSLSI